MRTLPCWLLLVLPFVAMAQPYDEGVDPTVDSLVRLSRMHTGAQEFGKAYTAAALATAEAQRCCGENSLCFASACFNEGRVYYFDDKNEKAIPWYEKSIGIREKLLAPDHYDLSKSYNNLAISLESLSRFEAAEPLYIKALRIRAVTHGKESLVYANALDNLADLYKKMGLYDRAESMGLEALRVKGISSGQHSIEYVRSLINIGALHYAMGNYSRAIVYQKEATRILEAEEMTNSIEYKTALNNLGADFQFLGQYGQSRACYEKVQRELEAEDEVASLQYFTTLYHLAALDFEQLDYGKAKQILTSVLQGMQKNELAGAREYNAVRLMLGDVLCNSGDYAAALQLLKETELDFKTNQGAAPENYLQLYRLMADAHYGLGMDEEGASYLYVLSEAEKEKLRYLRGFMTLQQLQDASVDLLDNQKRYLSQAMRDASHTGLCMNEVLLYKGLLLQCSQRLRQTALGEPSLGAIYDEYQACKRQLAAQYSLPEAEQENMAELENKAEELEKTLVKQSDRLADAWQTVQWQDVQARLQAGEAAVEFVRFQWMNPKSTDSTLYAALVLLPGAAAPTLLPLCEEEQLQKRLQTYNSASEAHINKLYLDVQQGSSLHSLIWEALEAHLASASVHTVYYSAAGLLHRVNLGAVATPDGQPLMQKYRLVALNSTRQLASVTAVASERTFEKSAILIGDVQYDLGGSEADALASRSLDTSGPMLQDALANEQARSPSWKPLPWTEVEVELAHDRLQKAGYTLQMWRQQEATEERFKSIGGSLPAPRVLHVATHGYFFTAPGEAMSSGHAMRSSGNPLIRSGLVLAGGNYAWQNGFSPQPDAEDGILTAYEVSLMDLSATSLVILSACETGLGDLRNYEGVFGLQRAFREAGARYLLMTLWQVSDFHAQAFVDAFYQYWLEEGQRIPDAFRKAQLAMQARFGAPFYWAGFVLVAGHK